jgi:hypothetical protein
MPAWVPPEGDGDARQAALAVLVYGEWVSSWPPGPGLVERGLVAAERERLIAGEPGPLRRRDAAEVTWRPGSRAAWIGGRAPWTMPPPHWQPVVIDGERVHDAAGSWLGPLADCRVRVDWPVVVVRCRGMRRWAMARPEDFPAVLEWEGEIREQVAAAREIRELEKAFMLRAPRSRARP